VQPDGVQSVHIRGLAERAASPVHRIGPDVTVPDSVPLRIGYDHRVAYGTAALRRDEAGIWADAEVFTDMLPGGTATLKDVPYLAVAVRVTGSDRPAELPVITAGEVVGVILCRENIDPDLPPWEVAYGE